MGQIDAKKRSEIIAKLSGIYSPDYALETYEKLETLMNQFNGAKVSRSGKQWVDQEDVMLITYGDSLQQPGQPHLETLHQFLEEKLSHTFSAVHILPFYPFTSDDGFSVQDYFEVNPQLGNWKDVHRLASDFDLMFDAVINHISSKSDWFEHYLKGDEHFRHYFIEADPNEDYSSVTRPRALPLLTEFETAHGKKHIWTTFSADQIDLNYQNPDVLLHIIKLLLFYVENGAKFIRLDAIGYLWKEIGTTCIHLKEAHVIIQLFREILEVVAPETIMITETNVPHKDNISYFGDGTNEAQMVYQFPLPPLTLHAFQTGNARYLSQWADELEIISDETTYFNFLASHDGIGVMPVRGILTENQVEEMADRVQEHGGFVSMKDNGDGTQSPYELNINYMDALSHPNDPQAMRIQRFLAAQGILLSLAGVPGIYIHSILGSGNDLKGVQHTGRYRSINREKLNVEKLMSELNTTGSKRNELFNRLTSLIQLRRQEKAFHPNGKQEILYVNDAVFAVRRTSCDEKESILSLVNVSGASLNINLEEPYVYRELITGTKINNHMNLSPYGIAWLKESEKR